MGKASKAHYERMKDGSFVSHEIFCLRRYPLDPWIPPCIVTVPFNLGLRKQRSAHYPFLLLIFKSYPSMDCTKPPILRSASLPSSTEDVCNVSFRRESEAVNPDAPMTPPMSPSQSENEGDNAIMVDTEHRPSDEDSVVMSPESTTDSSASTSWHDPASMQVEGQRPSTPPRPPARLLEDEQVHVAKAGVLKLTDFEVKGTLGGSCIYLRFCNPSEWYSRYRHFRSSATCSPQIHHTAWLS
jgi:hypothetical protein